MTSNNPVTQAIAKAENAGNTITRSECDRLIKNYAGHYDDDLDELLQLIRTNALYVDERR